MKNFQNGQGTRTGSGSTQIQPNTTYPANETIRGLLYKILTSINPAAESRKFIFRFK